MRNLKLTVAYDGTHFNGFQTQRGQEHVRTVQSSLESAWERLTGERPKSHGAGRTDAGVHAEGQVVNFRTEHGSIPESRVPYAMNSVLDPDVRVVGCVRVHPSFHARFDALSKVYVYRILNRTFPLPTSRLYTHFISDPLDVEAMDQAAALLVGRHDFATFAGSGGGARSTVRTMLRCEARKEGDVISVWMEADGFLYHMARAIVGTLLVVGKGEQDPQWVGEVLESRERSRSGATAPACGLTLLSVKYPL